MQRDVIVRFKCFKSFVVVAFLVNSMAFFAAFSLNVFILYVTTVLTLAYFTWCVRCATCGKSPFVKWVKSLRIGIPIPERRCSRCGRNYSRDAAEKLD